MKEQPISQGRISWETGLAYNMSISTSCGLLIASTALGALAAELANAAALAAAGRLREAAFGPAQKRKLKVLLGESVRVMLERLTRSGELAGDSDYVADLRVRLTNFFSVEEV